MTDKLAEAIKAKQARDAAVARAAQDQTSRKANEEQRAAAYFGDVVQPTMARIAEQVGKLGMPLRHLKGTMRSESYGSQIQETLHLTSQPAAYQDLSSHVGVAWSGGNDLHISGYAKTSNGGGPVQEATKTLRLDAPADELEAAVRDSLAKVIAQS